MIGRQVCISELGMLNLKFKCGIGSYNVPRSLTIDNPSNSRAGLSGEYVSSIIWWRIWRSIISGFPNGSRVR